ncbi:MAG: RNA polymerase sigma factor [Gemmatimonadota bacterium]|nr:MAG: RNA polymerase sigma factor [Gemmatimonadota bacterium]
MSTHPHQHPPDRLALCDPQRQDCVNTEWEDTTEGRATNVLGQAVVTDEAIIARFRQTGDPRWFEMLVVRHRDYVYRAVRRLLFDPEDAADLTQEVFVKAYLGLSQFRSQASFRTWLHRIAVNHSLNHLSRSTEPERSPMPASKEPSRAPEDREMRLDVQSCLGRLNPEDRLVLLLKYVEDLDHSEVAEMLSISVSASKMRVQRAKERFLRLYNGDEDG